MRVSDPIAAALFGKTRRRILALLFGRPGQSFYLREVARLTGLAPRGVQLELENLSAAGLITRVKRGQQVFFQADRSAPVFDELRLLMEKTIGLAGPLRAALTDLHRDGGIAVAFVYGSVAGGRHAAGSDIDLMVIGDTSLRAVAGALRDAQDRLGREITPSVLSVAEFAHRVAQGDHFISRVMEGPKILLIGSGDDLAGLGGERVGETP